MLPTLWKISKWTHGRQRQKVKERERDCVYVCVCRHVGQQALGWICSSLFLSPLTSWATAATCTLSCTSPLPLSHRLSLALTLSLSQTHTHSVKSLMPVAGMINPCGVLHCTALPCQKGRRAGLEWSLLGWMGFIVRNKKLSKSNNREIWISITGISRYETGGELFYSHSPRWHYNCEWTSLSSRGSYMTFKLNIKARHNWSKV